MATAIWVRTAPEGLSVTAIEEAAGTAAESKADVALALAVRLLARGELERGIHYARRSTELEPDVPQTWWSLAQGTHVKAQSMRHSEQRALLHEAELHYSKAIDLATAQQATHIVALAHTGRGVARSVLGIPEAGSDLRTACELLPNDADVRRKYVVHLVITGEKDKAVKEARRATDLDPGDESLLMLVGALCERDDGHDRQEANDLCVAGLVKAQERFHELLNIAITGLVRGKRFDEANRLIGSVSRDRLSDVGRAALVTEVQFARGETQSAESTARGALAQVTADTPEIDIRRLSESLQRLNLFALALPLLKRLARPGLLHPDTEILLDCANRAHDDRVIMDACRGLREAGVEDRRLLDIELNVLQKYNRPAAIGVLQAFLARHPDDKLARLRLSVLGMQSDLPELVVSDPNQLPSVDEVDDVHPEQVGAAVVRILFFGGRRLEALNFAYNLLRRNFDEAAAHHMYLAVVLEGERDGWTVDRPESVQLGTAVTYREKGDMQNQTIIIENDSPDPQMDEYPESHPRVLRLLGKHIGDEFSLASGVQERTGEVISIIPKYVFRFQDCISQFQIRFPNRGDIQRFQVTPEKAAAPTDIDIQPIVQALKQRRDHVTNVVNVYRSQPMPLHALATATGRSVFETMCFLAYNPNTGLRWCCQGSLDERELAAVACRDNRRVVLELTAIYTVWALKLSDFLAQFGRELLVTQSTSDALRGIAELESRHGARGRMAIDDRGRLSFNEENPEAADFHTEALQSLVRTIRERCSVVQVPETADLPPDEREKLSELFGRNGLDSIVLAARPGHLLWADDMTLAFALQENYASTRWAWTQAILQAAANEGVLTIDSFTEFSARLLGFQYSFTMSTVEIMLKAGAMAEWSCEAWPLRQVIGQFGLASVTPQAKLALAAGSIVEMFKVVSSPFSRQAFILAILNRLASRKLAIELARGLQGLFGLDVASAYEAASTIRDWLNGPLFI